MGVSLRDPNLLHLKVRLASLQTLVVPVMNSGHAADVLEVAVSTACVYVYLSVLALTAAFLVGNGQMTGRKASVKLSRSPPSKTGTISKASTSPPPERPATIIDPLSHVCLRPYPNAPKVPSRLYVGDMCADGSDSISSNAPIPKIQSLKNFEIPPFRIARIQSLRARVVAT